MIRPLLALLVVTTPALAADKLAPPRKVEKMLGVVSVYNASEEENCSVILYEDKTRGGYTLEQYEGCDAAYPVMAEVKAWRVYTNGDISFADETGRDLIRFHGKPYTLDAIEPVDGIVKIWSAQEVAE